MKRLIFLVFLICAFTPCTNALGYGETDVRSAYGGEINIEDEMGMYDIESLEGYTDPENDYYTDGVGFFETVKRLASGQEVLSVPNVLKALAGGFFSEAYQCFYLLLSAVAISLLFSALNNMGPGFNSTAISDTAFFVCYLVLSSLIVRSFSNAAALVMSTVKSAAVFVNAAAPVMMTMLAAGGGISSAAAVNPVLLLCIEIVTAAAENILMPLLYSSAALYIVSEINETIKVSKFADFLKKTVKWSLCLILTVFVGILSIQGFCAATLDGAAAKTAKYVVGTSVPVVGSILSDTIETVVGCSLVVKNATGAAGMIAVLIIVSAPIIKILAVSASFYFSAAVIEPVADKRISNVMSSVASVTSLMAAIIVTVALMFIICIGIIMCMSGATL